MFWATYFKVISLQKFTCISYIHTHIETTYTSLYCIVMMLYMAYIKYSIQFYSFLTWHLILAFEKSMFMHCWVLVLMY